MNNEIHENCFYDNEHQAWDDVIGGNNDWDGNYWSPPPQGDGNYTIPGQAVQVARIAIHCRTVR